MAQRALSARPANKINTLNNFSQNQTARGGPNSFGSVDHLLNNFAASSLSFTNTNTRALSRHASINLEGESVLPESGTQV
jgi:hypothetical protein